jgi:hypothetical protein
LRARIREVDFNYLIIDGFHFIVIEVKSSLDWGFMRAR